MKKVVALAILIVLCLGILPMAGFAMSLMSNNDSNKSYYELNKAIRSTKYFDIGDDSVQVDTLVYLANEKLYNPTFVQLELVNNSIKYKRLHPNEDVDISFTSFHFSAVAGGCLDTSSPNYGKMRSIYNDGYDKDGYVSLVYLLIEAAKIGINVRIIGQLNGQGGPNGDIDFYNYFKQRENISCEGELSEYKVKDFLQCVRTEWKSYGDRAAADMMHLKSAYFSHFIDNDGAERTKAVVLSSQNIDGISGSGVNGNNAAQTGVRIINHSKIYQTLANYTELLFQYWGQEDVYKFRDIVTNRNVEQYEKILNGEEDSIPDNEQILYLGSEEDQYFELYFTPLGGPVGAWDTKLNPYAKYTSKMLKSEDYLLFAYIGIKFNKCSFTDMWQDVINKAFVDVDNPQSRIFMSSSVNNANFTALKQGVNVAYKDIGSRGGYHSKDALMSYVENGVRYYVTVHTSTNMHEGAMAYQSNSMLVIKETKASGNEVFATITKLLANDLYIE